MASNDDNDLAIKEIMIVFFNPFAINNEESTGVGVFELPLSKTTYLEYGTSMMWNLKYGMKRDYGGIGNFRYP